ncbi:hypothetical protein UlMin_001353 [Ulmus minor]
MEKHKCKLCYRSFLSGRALGGHMKAHLATLPLPPKQLAYQLTEPASSSCSSSSEEEEHEQEQEQVLAQLQEGEEEDEEEKAYGLRENPKKSFRVADPEFSFAIDSGSVIQDRESETESKNPTRRRSKRNRRPAGSEIKKMNLGKPIWPESLPEPEPLSSVSDTSTEEDVAICLMMLSRDVWMRKTEKHEEQQPMVKSKKVRAKNRCEKCKKVFRSHQAMLGHKKICCRNEMEVSRNEKIFECPYCFKVFGSGQALGGHKRSHQINNITNSTGMASSSAMADSVKQSFRESLIDLNLPAPMEEDDFSVLSDA